MSRHQRYSTRKGSEQESVVRPKAEALDSPRLDLPRRASQLGLSGLPAGVWQVGNVGISQLLRPSDSGRPLDSRTRTRMEAAFKANFSDVRVHDDDSASEVTAELGARAVTTGRDIYFTSGAYAPSTSHGQHLLAHELAHVLQQSGRVAPDVFSSSHRGAGQLEAEADQAGESVASGRAVQIVPTSDAPAVQRQTTNLREQIIQLGESEEPGNRQRALDLILSTYYRRPSTLHRLEYDPDFHSTVSPHDAETGFAPLGEPQTIKIGPRFFNQFRGRFDQRARTIGHELQHVVQRTPETRRGGRTVGSTLLGIGAGLLGGGLLGAAGLGIAALAGAALGPLAIGLALGGGAALGGLIGGLADPFSSPREERQQPVQNARTREFLAIYWTVTAEVPGLKPLSRGQMIQNIRQPGAGALDQYRQMPREDQERYREQHEHLLRILRDLEREVEIRNGMGPEPPTRRTDVRLA